MVLKVYRPVGHTGPIYVPGMGTFDEGAELAFSEETWEALTPASRGHFRDTEPNAFQQAAEE